ncbi:hypothetical protein C8R43DRAFT_895962 [Mycena crocata]|nr:hypothetical protein C8R43DRAFT_895962 [Mycena crocata]
MDAESEPHHSAGRTTPTPRRRVPHPTAPVADVEVLSLDFACRRKSRSILNSTVVGRDGFTPYFHIMSCTDTHPKQTIFRTNKGATVATVEWGTKGTTAYVEVHKAVPKQRVSGWLSVGDDASYRMMSAHGQRYVWAPQGHSICVSVRSHYVPHLLARIDKEESTVTLDITVEAVNRGLLEMAVVATTLFQSGYSID